MKRTYLDLNINERINLKSHQALPLAYFFINKMLNEDINEAFQLIFKTPVSEMLKTIGFESCYYGMSAQPEFEKLYIRACTSK